MGTDPATTTSGDSPRPTQCSALFPWKLHEMLTTCESEGKDSVVSWLPGGKIFKVHDTAIFVGEILPHHFKQTKYKSFQRQLNLWGFQRITKGSSVEKGAYFHKYFLKDQQSLCRNLTRQNSKKSDEASKSSQQSSNGEPPEDAPEFVSVPESIEKSEQLDSTSTAMPEPEETSITMPEETPSLETSIPELLDDCALDTMLILHEIIEPVSFEGCPFFLLDLDTDDELLQPAATSKNSQETKPSTPAPPAASKEQHRPDPRDPLAEIDIASGFFSVVNQPEDVVTSSLHSQFQLCSV